MSNRINKNCSQLLLTNGMGLDGAPVKFFTLVFLETPYSDILFPLLLTYLNMNIVSHHELNIM